MVDITQAVYILNILCVYILNAESPGLEGDRVDGDVAGVCGGVEHQPGDQGERMYRMVGNFR